MKNFLFCSVALIVSSLTTMAQSPYLVKDILTEPYPNINLYGPSDRPQLRAKLNDMILFTMRESAYGSELWKSDGTLEGTALVKDIMEGNMGSNIQEIKVAGMYGFFSATNNNNGYELWKTDGTPEGTVMVKDIMPGSGGSGPRHFMVMGSTLYFFADYPGGSGFWKTDGTTEGTVLLSSEVNHPSGYSLFVGDIVMNSALYFIGNDSVHGVELWKTDGTAAGTVLVKDIRVGTDGSNITELIVMGSEIYFNAWDGGSAGGCQLWKSDGTAVGTQLEKTIFPGLTGSTERITNMTVMNGTLYFVAADSYWDYELWKSDGTDVGTVQATDINIQVWPYWGEAFINHITVFGSALYFFATDGIHGLELYKYDGTTTSMVKDIAPGPATYPGSGTANFGYTIAIGNSLYFSFNDGAHGVELWKTDGTEAGTAILKDIDPAGSSSPGMPITMNSMFYFIASEYMSGANTAGDMALWKSDGTEAGTVRIRKNGLFRNSSVPGNMKVYGSNLLFSINPNAYADSELWRSDGTAAGTVLVKYMPDDCKINRLVVSGSKAYFQADEAAWTGVGRKIYESMGTANSTIPIINFMAPTVEFNRYNEMRVIGQSLYFRAYFGDSGNNSNILYKYDSGASVNLKSFAPSDHGNYAELAALGNTLIFTAAGEIDNSELWKTDGTVAGTELIKDINPSGSSYPHAYTQLGSSLYFAAKDANSGEQLWKTDGTLAGTILVKNITGNQNAEIRSIAKMGTDLYFSIDDGINGNELWKSDGTEAGTLLLKDINPGDSGSQPNGFVVYNANLYFSADDGIHGQELWKTDGTPQGTLLVKDIFASTIGSSPTNLTVSGPLLYFSAYDVSKGNELWSTDGTDAGTRMVGDIRTGPLNSFPGNLTDLNGKLFFTAINDNVGQELWALGNCGPANPIVTTVGQNYRVGSQRQTVPATKTCFCDINNSLMTTVDAIGSNPLSGEIDVTTTIENFQPADHVKRITSIIPYHNFNIANATGKVTLYFTQQEFNEFNAVNPSVALPANENDNQGKSNARIYKSSMDVWELINPNDSDIVWNGTLNRWEITFDTTGFGYFMLVTNGLPLSQNDFDAAHLSYYPNPTNGMFYLEAQQSIDSVVLYDLIGHKVYEADVNQKQVALNLQPYDKGIYILTVSSQNRIQTLKVIKK